MEGTCDIREEAAYLRHSASVMQPSAGRKRRLTLGEYCEQTRDDTLLREWHPTLNGALTPSDVAPCSDKKLWWRCAKGHEWAARVSNRIAGCGCPVCANRKAEPGFNDLASVCPEAAAQWDAEKNGALTPRDVVACARRRVWWRCGKGHSWRATVDNRVSHGEGCPVCAGRKTAAGENDLATLFPTIAAEFDPEKNAPLDARQLSPHTNRKVWWRCGKGHSYSATVNSRTSRHTDCPYCTGKKVLAGFNDLATVEPRIAAQWHPTLNDSLTPETVTYGSHYKVWWICGEGHVWKATIVNRAGKKKTGCPVCAGVANKEKMLRYRAIAEQREASGL